MRATMIGRTFIRPSLGLLIVIILNGSISGLLCCLVPKKTRWGRLYGKASEGIKGKVVTRHNLRDFIERNICRIKLGDMFSGIYILLGR